jgi:hypothetical protein
VASLPALGDHGKPDLAFLDIKHGIGNIALGKDGLALLQVQNLPAAMKCANFKPCRQGADTRTFAPAVIPPEAQDCRDVPASSGH